MTRAHDPISAQGGGYGPPGGYGGPPPGAPPGGAGPPGGGGPGGRGAVGMIFGTFVGNVVGFAVATAATGTPY